MLRALLAERAVAQLAGGGARDVRRHHLLAELALAFLAVGLERRAVDRRRRAAACAVDAHAIDAYAADAIPKTS